MTRVLVPLAQGCEEVEAVTVIDLLRRADIEVVVAGLDREPVRASRGVTLVADTFLDDVVSQDYDAVVLPGGGPGADRLEADSRVREVLQRHAQKGKVTAAICAAPKVLAAAGLLDGKRATCYPGTLDQSAVASASTTLTGTPVEIDGTVITSRGPGTAMDFALALIGALAGDARRDAVEAELQRP